MDPERGKEDERLGSEAGSASAHPGSADDRLATLIRANQARMVDQLTANLWGFNDPGLRRTYASEAALRLFIDAFVEALRRSFVAADGKFVAEYGVSLGGRYAEDARDYEDVYNSLVVIKNSLLPFVLKADPPIEPLILRLTDVPFRPHH